LRAVSSRDRRSPARPAARQLALAGAGFALAAVLGGGLLRWRAVRLIARTTPPAIAEDPTELSLQRAVEARPGDAAARLRLGQHLEREARPFEALWEYAEAQRLAPADQELPLRLAVTLRATGEIDPARAQLTQALRARPEDMAARREFADLLLSTGEPQRARSLLEERRQAVWHDSEAALILGRAREACGDDPGASAAFQQAVSLDNRDSEALCSLGRHYLREHRIDQARDAFFHAMLYDQRRPEYPYYSGLTYLQQSGAQNVDRALRFFQEALALNSNYAPARYQTGVALEKLGRPSPALTQYSLATIADPRDPEPLPALSRGLAAVGRTPDAHQFMGRYDELKDRPAAAIQDYQRMQAAAPGDVQPALLIGQVYLRTHQNDKALAVTEAALKRHPRDPGLLERLAVMNINRGDWPAAQRLLQHWLSQDPQASRACWLLGRCELGALNYPEAVRWLEKANAIEPHNPHFLGYLGAALLKQDTPARRQRAAEVLAQSIALAPDEAEYRDLYGQALQALGRYDEARRQFLRALDADPTRIAAYLAASQLAWRLKQPGAASFFPALIRSVQQRESEEGLLYLNVWRHPTDTAGRLKLARFFCRTARLIQARDQLEQVPPGQPASPEARQLLQTVRCCLDAQ
jgi:tetratricopeptide (TPR) repeat protein